jgi:hypothetical protein
MSKYPNKYEIPEQFPEILSNFTREIVRNQPKDILDFAIKYFYNLEKKMLSYPSINSNKHSTINSEKNNNQTEILSSNNEQSDTDIIKDYNSNKEKKIIQSENSKNSINHNENNESEEYENNFINDSRENELIVPISKNLEELIKNREKEAKEKEKKEEENKNKEKDENLSEYSEMSGNDSEKQEVKDFISCLF